jgi:hypothetical protein
MVNAALDLKKRRLRRRLLPTMTQSFFRRPRS